MVSANLNFLSKFLPAIPLCKNSISLLESLVDPLITNSFSCTDISKSDFEKPATATVIV